MKKVILSLVGGLCMTTLVLGQTNVELAQNLPTVTGEGFEFKFQNNDVANCFPSPTPGSNNLWNTFTTAGFSVDKTGTGPTYPILQASGSQAQYSTMSIRLPEGNCGNITTNYIDMSTYKQIQLTVTSDVAVPKFSFMLAVDNSGWSVVDGDNSDPRTQTALAAGVQTTFTITSPSVNYLSVAQPLDKVIGFSISMNDASDMPIAANITVTSIKMGDAVTTTAVSNAEINNSLVSVYPNPAKDQINVDLSSLNTTDATVKIMNANGMVVYEKATSDRNEAINTASFNKGMYMVQVSAGNKISNKKIVIE